MKTISLIAAACAIAVSGPGSMTAAAAPAGSAALLQREHVSVRDEGGAGPAVILVPGLSSPRAVWDGVVPILKAGHHVLTVQVNGFGGDDPRANLSPGILDGIVAEVDAYIVANRLKSAAVIGHSLGGLVGMMLARAHPKHVGRLLIVDALPYVGDSFRPGITVAQVEPQAARMRTQIAGLYGRPHNDAATEEVATTLAATPEARARIKAWMQASDARVSGQAMYEDMTTDLRSDVASLQLPITLVYPADGDGIFHSTFANAPRVTYVPVAGAAHFVMLDQPAAFANAVREFLK